VISPETCTTTGREGRSLSTVADAENDEARVGAATPDDAGFEGEPNPRKETIHMNSVTLILPERDLPILTAQVPS